MSLVLLRLAMSERSTGIHSRTTTTHVRKRCINTRPLNLRRHRVAGTDIASLRRHARQCLCSAEMRRLVRMDWRRRSERRTHAAVCALYKLLLLRRLKRREVESSIWFHGLVRARAVSYYRLLWSFTARLI